MYFKSRQLPSTPEKLFIALEKGYLKIAEQYKISDQTIWCTITGLRPQVEFAWKDEQFRDHWVNHLITLYSSMVWNRVLPLNEGKKAEKQADLAEQAFQKLFR